MMVIVYSLIIAALIVCGQALWKAAVMGATKGGVNLLGVAGIANLLRSPKLYLGVLVYGAATLSYIVLLNKFKYFQVQSIVVGGSLIFTLIIAGALFGEHVTLINVVGVALILAGTLLVVR